MAQTEDVKIWDGSQWVSIAGPEGPPGAAATVSVLQTNTLLPGSQASVTNQGTATNAEFVFAIPQGAAGQAATVSVDSTTTGTPGTNAIVENVGSSSQAKFRFTIPRGEKGDPGTGVRIVGSVDTVQDLPSNYTGSVGDMYIVQADGHGYIWNGTGWTDAGKIQGPTGPKGDAATVVVGSTNTGDPGTLANVTNSGDSHAAVLQFTIPAGQQGEKGDPGANAECYVQSNQPAAKRAGAIWIQTAS